MIVDRGAATDNVRFISLWSDSKPPNQVARPWGANIAPWPTVFECKATRMNNDRHLTGLL